MIGSGQVCDGFVDCGDLSDECACEQSGAEPLCVAVLERGTLASGSVCGWTGGDNSTLLADRFCEDHAMHRHYAETHQYECSDAGLPAYGLRFNFRRGRAGFCDAEVECMFRDDECSRDCSNHNSPKMCPKQLSNRCGDGREYGEHERCDGVADCADGSDEFECPTRYYCDAGETVRSSVDKLRIVSVDRKLQVCNLVADCLDASDELNCTKESHFYCADRRPPRFLSRQRVLDGLPDCEDGSDECPAEGWRDNPFSDRRELFKNALMRVCVWLTGSLSIVANLVVLAMSKRKLGGCRQKNSVAYCNRLLVTNLALADLLMGFSLFALANKSLAFSGSYCMHDHAWRASSLCKLIGTVTVISTQTSINLLVVLTSLRLYVTLRPMTLNMVRHRFCWLMIALSWLVALVWGAVPSACQRDFVVEHWIGKSRFFARTMVTPAARRKFLDRTRAMLPHAPFAEHRFFGPGTYDHLQRHVTELGVIGYYGNHSVCFPNLYVSRGGDQGVHFAYSLCMITYNTLAIGFIAVSYVIIYRKSLVRHRSVSGGGGKSVAADPMEDERRFGVLHLDLVGPMPEARGYRYLLTMMDRGSRWLNYTRTPVLRAQQGQHQNRYIRPPRS
ncbi:MAG: 7 transmembrane receptor, partial [Planctomycetota bacterium]